MDKAFKKYISNWLPSDYILALLLVIFPLYNKLMPILLIALGITLFSRVNPIKASYKLFSIKLPFLWFILFFLAHFIGLIATENFAFAFDDIGMKLSFIVLPLILAFIRTKITVDQVIDLFLAGLFFACYLAYIYAIFKSSYNKENNQWAYFTDIYLAFMMHKSYFATYLVLGANLAIYRFFSKLDWIYILLAVLFTITTILTFSKAGIIILALTIIPTTIILSVKLFQYINGLILSALSIAVIVVGFVLSEKLQTRFEMMLVAISNTNSTSNLSVESNNSRIIMWSTSLELIKENPVLGVGTGDVKDELKNRNILRGNLNVANKNLNSHNQYLNTLVQLGIIGGVPLIMIFISSVLTGARNSSYPLIITSIIFAITLLFESFLERQAGVIPITLILLLLTLKISPYQESNNN